MFGNSLPEVNQICVDLRVIEDRIVTRFYKKIKFKVSEYTGLKKKC